jgi:Ca2+-binding RTX toxin-like protein
MMTSSLLSTRHRRCSSSTSGSRRDPSSLLLWLGLTFTACSVNRTPAPAGADADYPGLGRASSTLLSSNCVVSATGIAVQVNGGETAVISLSTDTGNINVNGTQSGGAPCQVAATLAVTVTPGTAGDHGVLLDFSSGHFSQATSAGSPKISLDLGSGANDTLSVRGGTGVDHFYFGRGVTATTSLFNFNGGTGLGEDAFPDVSIVGAEHLVVSSGAGNDILDASGLYGATGPYLGALAFFGGPDDDTLVGGAGNDTISGDSGNDALTGGAGTNVYACGTTSDGTDVVTVTSGAIDTIDYSQRFNAVSVVLGNGAVSGETGENDTIPDTVSVVLGGSGNDTLSAGTSTRNHTLEGGPGNDTLTGGGGADTLMGGNGTLQIDGDDVFIGSRATVDYSARTQALTVTMSSASTGGADANDGDPTTTRHVQSAVGATAGATITAASNTVTGLAQLNAGSVGHQLIIAGSAGGADDGSYRIAAVTSASVAILNAADTAANPGWANDAQAGWTYSEDAGPEHDDVRCRNLIGSAVAANTITGDGNDNAIAGGGVGDTLAGGPGSDTLNGLAGDDTLYGGAGDDTLVGGPGNDVLVGGDGNDVLEGDAGSDFFQCDGRNDGITSGAAPGNVDYTVDVVSGAPDNDTLAIPGDCEH